MRAGSGWNCTVSLTIVPVRASAAKKTARPAAVSSEKPRYSYPPVSAAAAVKFAMATLAVVIQPFRVITVSPRQAESSKGCPFAHKGKQYNVGG